MHTRNSLENGSFEQLLFDLAAAPDLPVEAGAWRRATASAIGLIGTMVLSGCGGGVPAQPGGAAAVVTPTLTPAPTRSLSILAAPLTADSPLASVDTAALLKFVDEHPTAIEAANLNLIWQDFQKQNPLFAGMKLADARPAAILLYDSLANQNARYYFVTAPGGPRWLIGAVIDADPQSRYTLTNQPVYQKADGSCYAGKTLLLGKAAGGGGFILTPAGNKVAISAGQANQDLVADGLAAGVKLDEQADSLAYDPSEKTYTSLDASGEVLAVSLDGKTWHPFASPDYYRAPDGQKLAPAADGTVYNSADQTIYQYNPESRQWQPLSVTSVEAVIDHIPPADRDRLTKILNLHQFDQAELTAQLATVDGQLTLVWQVGDRIVAFWDSQEGLVPHVTADWRFSSPLIPLEKQSAYFTQSRLRQILADYQPLTLADGTEIPLGVFPDQTHHFSPPSDPTTFPNHATDTFLASVILFPPAPANFLDPRIERDDLAIYSRNCLFVQADGQITILELILGNYNLLPGLVRISTPQLIGYDPATGKFIINWTTTISRTEYNKQIEQSVPIQRLLALNRSSLDIYDYDKENDPLKAKYFLSGTTISPGQFAQPNLILKPGQIYTGINYTIILGQPLNPD